MSNIKLFQVLEALQKKNKSPLATKAVLNILDNALEINLNGIFSNILINYEGAVVFDRKFPIYFKALVGKNIILIGNLFKKKIPELIFEYTGDLKIISCKVTNFSGGKINATINNNQLETIINHSKTNLEDETKILVEELEEESIYSTKRGLTKLNINEYDLINKGKAIKYTQREIADVTSIITEVSPKLAKVRKLRKKQPATRVKKQIKKKVRGKY